MDIGVDLFDEAKRAGIADGYAVKSPNKVLFYITKMITQISYNDWDGFLATLEGFREVIGRKGTLGFIAPVAKDFPNKKRVIMVYLQELNNTIYRNS